MSEERRMALESEISYMESKTERDMRNRGFEYSLNSINDKGIDIRIREIGTLIRSLTKSNKILDEGHDRIIEEFDEIIKEFENYSNKKYVSNMWIGYIGDRLVGLNKVIKTFIESGQTPNEKQGSYILTKFQEIQNDIGRYQDIIDPKSQESLDSKYASLRDEYLNLIQTKQKEEKPIENTAYSSIAIQKEESGGNTDYASEIIDLEEIIEPGKMPDEEETNQRKDELDGMIEQSSNKVILEPGRWKLYQSKKFEKIIPEGETEMYIKKILPDMGKGVVFVEFSCGLKKHIEIEIAEEMVKEKMPEKEAKNE